MNNGKTTQAEIGSDMHKRCSHIAVAAEKRLERQIDSLLAAFDDPSIPKHRIKRQFRASADVLARVIGRVRGVNAWDNRPYCAPEQCRPGAKRA